MHIYRFAEGGRLSRPLATAVKVRSPCPRLYIAAAVVINTAVRGEIRTLEFCAVRMQINI